MADTISDAIKNIRMRRRKLEAELRLLAKAEKSLCRIAGTTSSPISKAKPVGDVPPHGVSGVILSALKELGQAESGEVIEHVRKRYLPDANENTIRSLLSVWAVKGRVIRNGKKYSLPKATEDEAGKTKS